MHCAYRVRFPCETSVCLHSRSIDSRAVGLQPACTLCRVHADSGHLTADACVASPVPSDTNYAHRKRTLFPSQWWVYESRQRHASCHTSFAVNFTSTVLFLANMLARAPYSRNTLVFLNELCVAFLTNVSFQCLRLSTCSARSCRFSFFISFCIIDLFSSVAGYCFFSVIFRLHPCTIGRHCVNAIAYVVWATVVEIMMFLEIWQKVNSLLNFFAL